MLTFATSVSGWSNDGSTPERRSMDAFLQSPFATIEVHGIDRNWRSMHVGGQLPLYEEVVLGRAGRIGSHVAVLRPAGPQDFSIHFAGEAFVEWIGEKVDARSVSLLPPDCRRTLKDALDQAVAVGCPVHSVAHAVRLGYVQVYDLVVFPLASRWGGLVMLAYVRLQQNSFSLVDAIFASSLDGLLALAPITAADESIVDFQIVSLNDAVAQLVAKPIEQLRWSYLSELFPLVSKRGIIDRLANLQNSRPTAKFEIELETSSGQTIYFSVNAAAMTDLVAVSLVDVTAIKQREHSFRLLFKDNPIPMLVFVPSTLEIIDVNSSAIEHYGYSREEFLAMNLLDIRPAEDREIVRNIMASQFIPSDTGDVWRHLKADGTIIEVQVFSRAVTFEGREARISAYIDVTEQRRAEARISHMAHHDSLTSLPNRSLFHNELRKAMASIERHGGGAALLCIDLDFFKDVNDTLGHPVGDKLLKQVSQRLLDTLRETDLVARLGGDEFAVLQLDLGDLSEAGTLADRLIDAVSQPYEIDGHQVVVGASVGIALAPSDGTNPDDLLRNADMALYRAKYDGRGTSRYFQSDMDAQVKARRQMELELRGALARGEFDLFYQPIVASKSQEVVAFEALLRWKHPTRGTVAPDAFIPLAEQIGLINPIGEWVLRRACHEAAKWPQSIRVAVNLSAVQFKAGKLAGIVASAIANAGLSPDRLELEITESVLLRDSDANLVTLKQLRELGVRISMDDFGTGYSSLSYLRSFPFDKIKIDRSFVRDLANNTGDIAIVRAVTGLGNSLGMVTTAEGVETREQLERLVAEGCTEIQGYLFGRPVPATDIFATINRLGSTGIPA